jgi:hypothetical protein
MRASFVLRIIRQALDRALAGERGLNFDKLGAELASIVSGTWVDPETLKPRPVPEGVRLRAVAVALDLWRMRRCRHAPWPQSSVRAEPELRRRSRYRPSSSRNKF